MKRYKLNIIDIKTLSLDAKEITFELPQSLKSTFTFIPGQYLTLYINDKEGTEQTRCYSICSSPNESSISIGVKRVQGGKISPILVNDFKVGDSIEVLPPKGNFKLQSELVNQYILFAGGSGITPMKSIIETLLSNDNEELSIHLIYGNRNQESIMFDDYLSNIDDPRLHIIHCLQEENSKKNGAYIGLLNKEKNLQILNSITERSSGFHTYHADLSQAQFYICGPSIMMEEVQKALRVLKVPEKNVHLEYFTIQLNDEQKSISNDTERAITIIKDGSKQKVKVAPKQTILQAALAANIEIPNSCNMGICSSCICQVEQGDVQMVVDHGLTDEQKEKGYILTCQSIPKSDDIVLNLDGSTPKESPFKNIRKLPIITGLLFSLIVIAGLSISGNESFVCLGSMNTGHEDLACQDCHEPAKGTLYQQLEANVKFVLGQRSKAVDFGLQDVDNKDCNACHDRPNDKHPSYRFKEPRFKEARQAIHPELCESCHLEHNETRIFIQDLTYCRHCHEDLEFEGDPLDVKHQALAEAGEWQTCLQCHDFHGNHKYEIPIVMKDTIPWSKINSYATGGEDAYGDIKKYLAKEKRDQ